MIEIPILELNDFAVKKDQGCVAIGEDELSDDVVVSTPDESEPPEKLKNFVVNTVRKRVGATSQNLEKTGAKVA